MPSPAIDNLVRRWIKTTPTKVCSLCLLAALPLAALSNPQLGLSGAEFRRLPPIHLPQTNRFISITASGLDEMDDIIRFAGGAVELRVRQGWWVWEVPTGREVRVALSPTRPDSLKKVPTSGYWVCFHLSPANSTNPQEYLAQRMQQRMLEISGGDAEPLESIRFQRIGPWDAAELEFSLPPSAHGGTTAIRGSHVLVSTPGGLFEFHMQFPIDRYEEHLDEVGWILSQVRLTAPTVADAGPPTPETIAATPIHGSWKAFRSRLRLFSDGRIEIAIDRVQLILPPPVGLPAVGNDLLQGQYRAEGDLLFVQWLDGSKLNFRWTLKGGELLLTDHEGQISRLRRIAE